jgi:hypothetical protein
MKPPQFTLRVLAAFIALVAFTVRGYVMWRRSAEFAARARFYESRTIEDEFNLRQLSFLCSHLYLHEHPRECLTASEETDRAYIERWLRYDEHMSRKYRHASRFPWLSIGLDPATPSGR